MNNNALAEVLRVKSAGLVGIATSTPWRTLSVTGTVGFDGLTGSTGAGSLCLDSNKQVVYNSASDNCLSSTRATKHDITPLSLDNLQIVNALQPVSFVYNQGDGRVRYGFIAEDTAAVDGHLATYNASGTVSGIDDRSIIAILVAAVKEIASTIAGFAEKCTTKELIAINVSADTVTANQKICLGSRCMTAKQFNHLLDMEAAAGAATTEGGSAGAPGGSPASGDADATLTVNGNNPVVWQLNTVWQDNLGALFTHIGQSETIYSTSTIDVTTAGTTTIDYWAVIPTTQQFLHATRDIVILAPANNNAATSTPPAADDNSPPEALPATGTD
jgi:hypothetical protein